MVQKCIQQYDMLIKNGLQFNASVINSYWGKCDIVFFTDKRIDRQTHKGKQYIPFEAVLVFRLFLKPDLKKVSNLRRYNLKAKSVTFLFKSIQSITHVTVILNHTENIINRF